MYKWSEADQDAAVWNEELLGVGGYLARSAYEQEMENISSLWKATEDNAPKPDATPSPDNEIKARLRERALHALKFYTFHASTPSARLAVILEEAFFSCVAQSMFASLGVGQSASQLPIISTVGIRGATDVLTI